MSELGFKVGDEVVLSGIGKRVYENGYYNPHDLKGVVEETIDDELILYVRWSNGTCNSYETRHLYLSNPVKESKILEGMKPFNLQRALAGEPVVCRDLEDEVTSVTLEDNRLIVDRGGFLEVHNLDGTYHGGDVGESPADLFMKTKTEKRWMCIGKDDLEEGEVLPKEKKRYLYNERDLKTLVIMEGYQLVEFEVEVG